MLQLNTLAQPNYYSTRSNQHQQAQVALNSTAREDSRLNSHNDQLLAKAYRTLESRAMPVANKESDFSPTAVTDRIMGFIEQRLTQEKANGASPERLQELYKQAVTGVEKGLREAKEIIQSSGLFKADVEDNFNSTTNLLADRLQALSQQYFGTQKQISSDKSVATVSANQVTQSQQREFKMEVVTQDGDRVTLLVNAKEQSSSSAFNLNFGGLELSGNRQMQSSESQFSFSVEGELDAGEMDALSQLFNQVNDVAKTFYAGDVEQAFNQAMDVGMDSSELAAFRVDITQAKSMVAKNTYAEVSAQGNRNTESKAANVLDRLTDFANKVAQAREAIKSTMQTLANADELFNNLVKGLPAQRPEQVTTEQPFSRYIDALPS